MRTYADTKSSRIGVCLLVDTVGHDAGTEHQVLVTARELDKSRFNVHVCCLEPSPQLRALADRCRIAVFPVKSINSWEGLNEADQFRQYLRRNRIQIVHAYMNKTAIFAVFSCFISDWIVITSRLNTGYWYTPALRAVFSLLDHATTRIVANSEQAKRIAVQNEHLPPDKVDVIYQGVDMSVFRQGLGDPAACEQLGIPRKSPVVGIVANLRPVKDIPLFLRAASLVAREVPDACFLIVGHGEQLPELQRLAAELGLQDQAFFTGGKGRVMDYLSRMSIGCLTSQSEGFSNAILEYMAAGLPVVAVDVGGNGEAIVDGKTGYLVAERTPEKLAEPMIRLLTHEAERKNMGQRSFTRCLEHFELHRTIKDLENYYSFLCSHSAGGKETVMRGAHAGPTEAWTGHARERLPDHFSGVAA